MAYPTTGTQPANPVNADGFAVAQLKRQVPR